MSKRRRVVLVDQPAANIKYVGTSDDVAAIETPGAATDKPIWRIKRVVTDGALTTVSYADSGKFSLTWDDRVSYFPAAPSPASDPDAPVVSNPLVELFVLADADTEYAVPIRSGTKRYSVKARGFATLQLSYTAGDVDTVYKTIPPGCEDEQDRISQPGLTLYLQSPKANVTVEVETWV